MNRVLWKTSSLDANIASIRYRCLIPHKYMEQLKIKSDLFWAQSQINWNDYKTLIFVKTFTHKDIELAKEAKASGVQIVFDLCDNIYFDYPHTAEGERRNKSATQQRINFEAIVSFCDFVVVPTENFKCTLQKKITIPIYVVPDAIETAADSADFKRITPVRFLKLQLLSIYNIWTVVKLKYQIYFKKNKFILWFGNSGFYGVSGITDILLIKNELNKALAEGGGELIVCTDNLKLYQSLIASEISHTKFVQWNSRIVEPLLKLSHATIIPSPQNTFTEGKSNNRTLLSIYNGVPVIASTTSAIIKIKNIKIGNFIYIENWYQNLVSLLNKKCIVPVNSRDLLLQDYGGLAIAKIWDSILNMKARSIEN